MCDQELIAAILEELGYLNEKEENDKKEEVPEKGNTKDKLKNTGEEEQK